MQSLTRSLRGVKLHRLNSEQRAVYMSFFVGLRERPTKTIEELQRDKIDLNPRPVDETAGVFKRVLARLAKEKKVKVVYTQLAPRPDGKN